MTPWPDNDSWYPMQNFQFDTKQKDFLIKQYLD